MIVESDKNIIFQRDPEFQKIKEGQPDTENDYTFGDGCVCRRIFFSHCIKALLQNRRRNKEIQEMKEDGIEEIYEVKDIPDIKNEESMHEFSNTLNEYLRQIMIEDQATQITASHMLGALIKQFKWDIFLSSCFFAGQSICRLGFSVMFYYLLLVLMDLENNSFVTAYLLAFFSGVVWLIGQCFMHNAYLTINIFTTKVRSSIMGLLFKKLTKISQYMAKSQELGKIINMFSNDFNLIELKAVWFFPASSAPIVVIGAIALLITRLGWYGVICPAAIIVLFPIQVLIGKLNGSILKNINIFKDERVKTCTEIIEGIKFIKLYGWQMAFKEIIQALRKDQIKNFLKLGLVKSTERAFGNSIALWSGFICFLVMHFVGQGDLLNTANIFSTLQILVTLRLSIFYFGIGSGYYFEVMVILERYAGILNFKDERMIKIDEISKQPIKMQSQKNLLKGSSQNIYLNDDDALEINKGEIQFKDFNGYWTTKEFKTPNLKNINLYIKKGDFCGITGKVGSGKSGLLGVILEQIPYYSGGFGREGIVSYVEQQPVLFSDSVKENILFGAQFYEDRYNKALKDSCLLADLQLLENGEDTIVGEKGITLSGGQKARLALARAIYTDADIYLFDDPISAVDAKVAKQIYQRVMLKLCNLRKTVVLVTHQISYLKECDQVIIMDDGRVAHNGTPQQLKEELRKFQLSEKQQKEEEEKSEEEQEEGQEQVNPQNNMLQVLQPMERRRQIDENSVVTSQKSTYHKLGQSKKEKDVEVTCSTYSTYIKLSKTNYILFPVTIFAFLLSEAFNALYLRLLANYGDVVEGIDSIFANNDRLYMGVLGLILFNHFILFIVKYVMFQMIILYSNQELHKVMIQGLVRSPCSYFDTTPTGQLTNRFSNDLGILDTLLGFIAVDALEGPIYIVVSMVNVFIIDLFFMIPGLINLFCLVLLLIFCNQLVINAKKLDLRMKNPVFSTVNEVISGLIQIRIFNRRGSILKKFNRIVDESFRSTINFWICSRTFGVYGSYISMIILIVGFILGIRNIETDESLISSSSLAGLYGVTVVFLLQINDNVQWSLRQINFMETIMVSAERSFVVKDLLPERQLRNNYDREKKIKNLNQNKSKASKIGSSKSIKSNLYTSWPKKAAIQIKNFSLRYRPQLPLVLKGISFIIQEGEKVGIVGRTGAGKSSIIQALFRIVEPEEESVYQIDDCDALKLGLHTLRHRLSVIPQIPFLFKGDIKTNLDPFSKHSEEVLWDALESAGLKDSIEKLPEKLQTNVSNIAEVFSVGQKQLLCLARALLRNNKFLILDEATSNVDMETDYFIQKCIHTKFQDTTVITIAHRLNTIADYDKVIVMSRGRIIEIGEPHQLIQNNGAFAEMVSHTGKNADLIRKIAKNSFENRNRS